MLCSVKETVSHREKIIANHISDKELTPKIYKKILKNSKIRKQPNEEMGKRYEQPPPRKIHRWQINIWRDAWQHLSSGKCKLKQWDTTIQILKWLQSMKLTIPQAEDDAEQHSLLTGTQNAKSHSPMKNSLAICYKAKSNLYVSSSIPTPRYLPNWSEHLCPQKKPPVNVYSNYNHNPPNWKQPKCLSIGEWKTNSGTS